MMARALANSARWGPCLHSALHSQSGWSLALSLILDTSTLLAALDGRDPDHVACATLLEQESGRRIVPSPVLTELDYMLRRSGHADTFIDVLEEISAGLLGVEDPTRDDYVRVREIQAAYADAPVGFVDATVLAIVERLGETKLATLDRRHFTLMRPRHVETLELLPHL